MLDQENSIHLKIINYCSDSPLTLSFLTFTIKQLKFINERFNLVLISMRRKKYTMKMKYNDIYTIYIYINIHIYIIMYILKKRKHYTEQNVFRINKIDTWMSFWTLNKSRHLSKVLLFTLNRPSHAGFCSNQSFCSKFNKILFSWIPLLFQKNKIWSLYSVIF